MLSFGMSTNSRPLRRIILPVPNTIAPQNIRNKSDSVLYSCENSEVAQNIDTANSRTVGNCGRLFLISRKTVNKTLSYRGIFPSFFVLAERARNSRTFTFFQDIVTQEDIYCVLSKSIVKIVLVVSCK